jgi:hypothetical protein
MTARQINALLWTGSAAIAAASIGALLFGFNWPLDRHTERGIGDAKPTTQPSASIALPPLESFSRIWNTELRQPLGDPAPAPPAPPPTAVAAPPPTPGTGGTTGIPVTLAGTIGQSLALLRTATNGVEVCAVGESIQGVTVVAVRPAEVDVRFNGQVVKLSKPVEK